MFSTREENIAKRRASLTPEDIEELFATATIFRFLRGSRFHCDTVPIVAHFLGAASDPRPEVRRRLLPYPRSFVWQQVDATALPRFCV